MLTCKKQHSAKYTERNTPPYDANTCKVGTSRKGNNGLMYVVSAPNRNGFKRWVQKSPSTTTRRSSTTTRRTTRRRPVYTRPVYTRRVYRPRRVYTRRVYTPRRRRDDFWSGDDYAVKTRDAATQTTTREMSTQTD